MKGLARVGGFLVERQQGLLVLLLAVLHFTLLNGGGSPLGLGWWLADVGLFMLWQPFVHAERRLGWSSFSLGGILLAIGVWGFGNWLLLLWTAFVAALVGGRVLFVGHRATRIFYLLAFAYLLIAVLLFLVPRVIPNPGGERALLERLFVWGGPLLLAAMALMPARASAAFKSAGPVDFIYSLFVFLLIAVLVLGSLAFIVIRQASYIEALFCTLAVMSGMLLLLGWAWNPRPGFGGVGALFSRYLLTVGLPFEQWLHQLTRIAEDVREPKPFLDRALRQMLDLPWVEGGDWTAGDEQGSFGAPGAFAQEFSVLSLRLRLYSRYRLSPALAWHSHLLTQIVAEYHQAKLRERELEQVSYLRAVYETGARLTHDVKNLLQSLNNLCYVAQAMDGAQADELRPLMQRQLPLITQRLEQTLDKLRRPRGGAGPLLGAESWWSGLQQRYSAQGVDFETDSCLSDALVPTTLFDSVVDNLLQNALEKRARDAGVAVRVTMSDGGRRIEVADCGPPVPPATAAELFSSPVASESGLGIGLYHAALQAEELGYRLRLVENRPGAVRFELAQAVA